MSEEPYAPRISIVETGQQTLIHIPARRQLFGVVFTIIWALFFSIIAKSEISSDKYFARLIFDVILILAILYSLVNLFGYEELNCKSEVIIRKKILLLPYWFNNYSAASMRRLRWQKGDYRMFQPENAEPMARIAFDYGSKSAGFAKGVDEAEAFVIIATLQRRYGWSD
jgi:hypothetical protein